MALVTASASGGREEAVHDALVFDKILANLDELWHGQVANVNVNMVAHALVDLDLSPERGEFVCNFRDLTKPTAALQDRRHKFKCVAVGLADVARDGRVWHQLPPVNLLLTLGVGRNDTDVSNSPTQLRRNVTWGEVGFRRKLELDAKSGIICHLDGSERSHGSTLLELVNGRPGSTDARQGGGVLVMQRRATAASHTDAAGNGAVHGLPGGKPHDRPLPMLGSVRGLGWDGGVAHEFTGLEGGAEIEDYHANYVGHHGRRDVDVEGDIVILPEGARTIQWGLTVGEMTVSVTNNDLVTHNGWYLQWDLLPSGICSPAAMIQY